jgi:hypothetical protein
VLRIDAPAGHGRGSTQAQRNKLTAGILAFLLHERTPRLGTTVTCDLGADARGDECATRVKASGTLPATHPSPPTVPGASGEPLALHASVASGPLARAPACSVNVCFCPDRGRGAGVPAGGPRGGAVQHDPDRCLIRRPVPAGDRVPQGAQPGQAGLASPPDPLAGRGEPVGPGRGERADGDRGRAGQRGRSAPAGSAGPGSASSRCPVPAARSGPPGTGPGHARARARQCRCGQAAPGSRRPHRPP